MQDPTRIAPLLSKVERLWSALPDHSFAQLIELISPDYADDLGLERRLDTLIRRYPAHVSDCPSGCQVHTLDFEVTLTGGLAVVRPLQPRAGRPSVWPYERITAGSVAGPLRIVDTEGISRSLGVITGIAPLSDAAPPSSLRRRSIGDAVFLVDTDTDTRVVIGRRIAVHHQERRRIGSETLTWSAIPTLAVDAQLVAQRPSGQDPVELGKILRVLRLA